MAGDWIKFEVTTPDKPEVFEIASHLEISPNAALGALMRVWCWYDQHTEDGNDHAVTRTLIDNVARQEGMAEAMEVCGWLVTEGKGYQIPRFDRHNGKTAKNRALTAKRQADFKRRGNGIDNEEVTTGALPREEKRREEIKETQIGASGLEMLPSNIPYKEIVSLFNEHMGQLPMVRELTLKRRQLVRAAWQASKVRRDLKFWKAYFEEAQDDPFLNGTGPYGKGHENWRPTFDYLMRNDVITKTYEKAMSR